MFGTIVAISSGFAAVSFLTYLALTGQGRYFDVANFLLAVSPYTWALIGMAMSIALSVVGAAWYYCLS